MGDEGSAGGRTATSAKLTIPVLTRRIGNGFPRECVREGILARAEGLSWNDESTEFLTYLGGLHVLEIP